MPTHLSKLDQLIPQGTHKNQFVMVLRLKVGHSLQLMSPEHDELPDVKDAFSLMNTDAKFVKDKRPTGPFLARDGFMICTNDLEVSILQGYSTYQNMF